VRLNKEPNKIILYSSNTDNKLDVTPGCVAAT